MTSRAGSEDERPVAFADRFRQCEGRAPRVLHIGNIANNAYLNAKILNRAGFDCDVICYDYYHIMGCPEWEDAEIDGDLADQAFPNWGAVNLNGFERPRWFVQGNQVDCLRYLLARRQGNDRQADRLWRRLQRQRTGVGAYLCQQLLKGVRFVGARTLLRFPMRLLRGILDMKLWSPVVTWVKRLRLRDVGVILGAVAALAGYVWGAVAILVIYGLDLFRPAARYALQKVRSGYPPAWEVAFERRVAELVDTYGRVFPDRPDRLAPSDLERYRSTCGLWQQLLEHYDAVVGYATDGAYPLVAGQRPYLAYEHGTIRRIPFESTPQGRLCALTYRLADATLITNCDNLAAAEALGVPRYRFVPHPVNEDFEQREAAETLRRRLLGALDAEFLVFHPSRQHWEPQRHPSWEKGNDILIKGFARFVHEVCPRAGAVFVGWGRTLDQSRQLLASLGVADRVLWVPPMPNRPMIRHIRACDLLADQFFLGAFGSTMPKALLHGCPAMLYLDEEKHRWCFPEMPPVINARTPEEVFEGLKALYEDPGWRRRLIERGQGWYHRYHSSRVIAETFGEVFDEVSSAGHESAPDG